MEKIVFFGTNNFAVSALRPLAENFNIVLVITKPAKPAGRKQILSPTPVEIEAKRLGLKTISPEKLDNKILEQIKEIHPSLFIIVDYGKIIPQDLLDVPTRGAINVHPSALPKYRGASPLQTAILNGEKKTAISIMLIDKKMDHGPILTQMKTSILVDDDYGSLYSRLSQEYPKLLITTVKEYLSGNIVPQKQNDKDATFTKILKREDGKIDWTSPAEKIEKIVRAYNPWPGTFCEHNGKRIKIFKTSVSSINYSDKSIGHFFKTDSNELASVCGKNTTLLIHSLQPEGKKQMSGKEFIAGYLKQ